MYSKVWQGNTTELSSYRAGATVVTVLLATHALLDLAVEARVAGWTMTLVVAPVHVDTRATIATRFPTCAEVQV